MSFNERLSVTYLIEMRGGEVFIELISEASNIGRHFAAVIAAPSCGLTFQRREKRGA